MLINILAVQFIFCSLWRTLEEKLNFKHALKIPHKCYKKHDLRNYFIFIKMYILSFVANILVIFSIENNFKI